MGQKKDEPKKQKITLKETKQKAKVESEKTELQEKIDRLTQSLWKRISDPIDTWVNPAQRADKLIFLYSIYFEFNRTHDAFRLSQGYRVYYGKFKDLLKNNIREYLPIMGNIQEIKKLSTKLFLDFPDDLLISVFSFFLSSKWDPIRDPRDIPILFVLLFFYYEHIEERLPYSLVYQMDIAVMRLIWEVMVEITRIDKEGRGTDRTSESTKTIRANKDQRMKGIITLWEQLKERKGVETIGQMTRNKIATVIKNNSQKLSQDKKDRVSINTINTVLEHHFKFLNEPPPWKPVKKKFIKM